MHYRDEENRAATTSLAPAADILRSSMLSFYSLIHPPYQSVHIPSVLSRLLKTFRPQNVSEVKTEGEGDEGVSER